MNWLNLDIATLSSESFLGSEPVDRATWLCLMRYCAIHENGGVIADCATWADRKWQQLCALTKTEVHRECPLWTWEGESLVVWNYPVDREAEIQAKREGGRQRRKGHESSDTSSPEAELRRNRKGNSKGKEGEGNSCPPAFVSAPTVSDVIAHGKANSIPDDFSTNYHFKATNKGVWFNTAGLIDWRAQILEFWERDKATWKQRKGKGVNLHDPNLNVL